MNPTQVHHRILRGVQYANLIQQAAEAARTADVFAEMGNTDAATTCRALSDLLRREAAGMRGGQS